MDLIDIISEYQINPPKEDRLIALDNKLEELRQYIKDNKEYLDNLNKKFYIYMKRESGESNHEDNQPYIVINYEDSHTDSFYTDHYEEEDSNFISNIPGIIEIMESIFTIQVFYKDKSYENNSNILECIHAEIYEYSNEEQLNFLCAVVYELQKTGHFYPDIDPTDNSTMSDFELYRNASIGDFIEDLYDEKVIPEEYLSVIKTNKIIEAFEEHRICYALEAKNYADEDIDIFHSSIYADSNGGSNSITIECEHCQSVIFDADSLDD